MKRMLRKGYYMVNKAPSEPSMSVEDRARLTSFYAPHNKRLAEQLTEVGLSLPAKWS